MYTCCTLYVAQRWGREGASCFLNHCQGRFQQAGALKKPLDSGLRSVLICLVPLKLVCVPLRLHPEAKCCTEAVIFVAQTYVCLISARSDGPLLCGR